MKLLTEHIYELLSESLSTKDFKPAMRLMKSYFNRRFCLVFTADELTLDNVIYTPIVIYHISTRRAAVLLWGQTRTKSLFIDGVVFIDNFDSMMHDLLMNNTIHTKSNLTLKMNGASLSKSLPMIYDVLEGNLSYSAFSDEIENYKMFESFDINEVKIDIVGLKKESDRAYQRWYNARKKKHSEMEITRLEKEFRDKDAEYRRAQLQISSGETIEISNNSSKTLISKAEEEYESRATPQERFSDMEKYIKMVVTGLHPGLIICGAPGIGKTFRVMQYVKTTHQYGENLEIIKGRSTPANLYTALYNYSKAGDLIVIDDADEVFEDVNSVNILKAALDSGEERLVSYGTTRPPEISEEDAMMRHPELEPDSRGKYLCPKSFFFEGNVIFITNLRAGQLDTALRSRCYICEMEFTVEESLEIIKTIMISGGNPKISRRSKELAYEYLKSLVDKGTDMEISLRTFDAVSKIYEAGGDEDERQFKRMVHDFVTLQFARGGKRF